MSGTAGEAVQYRLPVDTSRDYMYRHHIATYTGTGVDLHDASGGASFIFAGVIYTSWPYQEQAALYVRQLHMQELTFLYHPQTIS